MTARRKDVGLTKAQKETVLALLCDGTVYQVASRLFRESFGIFANRAQGRLQTLKRMGLAEKSGRVWRLTQAGRIALAALHNGRA